MIGHDKGFLNGLLRVSMRVAMRVRVCIYLLMFPFLRVYSLLISV